MSVSINLKLANLSGTTYQSRARKDAPMTQYSFSTLIPKIFWCALIGLVALAVYAEPTIEFNLEGCFYIFFRINTEAQTKGE